MDRDLLIIALATRISNKSPLLVGLHEDLVGGYLSYRGRVCNCQALLISCTSSVAVERRHSRC